MFIAKNIGDQIYDFEYGNRKNNKWVGTYTTLTYDYQEKEKDYVPVKHMVFNVDPLVGKRTIFSKILLPQKVVLFQDGQSTHYKYGFSYSYHFDARTLQYQEHKNMQNNVSHITK